MSKNIIGMDVVVLCRSDKCITNVKKKGVFADKNKGVLELRTGDQLTIYFIEC